MKNKQLLLDAISKADQKEVRDLITQFIILNENSSVGKMDMFKFVAHDQLRPVMMCIFHENGFKIASNGHCLAQVRCDYPVEMEGKLINKSGAFEDGRYPNYNAVIPLVDNTWEEVNIDCKSLQHLIKKAKIEEKVNIDQNYREAVIQLKSKSYSFYCKPRYLELLLLYERNTLGTKWYINGVEGRCISGVTPDRSQFILMPIIYNEERQYIVEA